MHSISDQQRKALDLRRNIVVLAGAGSGKTTILVNRYLHILLENPHLSIKNVLAITFTEKATAEMKERIFHLINERFRQSRTEQSRLFEVLNQLYNAQIFTIHSFCSNILGQFPVESGVGSDFTILDDLQIEALLNRSFNEFLLSPEFKNDSDKEAFKRVLREFPMSTLQQMFFTCYRKRTTVLPFILSANQLSLEAQQNQWKQIYLDYHQQIITPLLHHENLWKELKILAAATLPENSNGLSLQSEVSNLLEKYQSLTQEDKEEAIALIVKLTDLFTKKDGGAYTSIPGGKKAWGNENVIRFQKLSQLFSEYFPVIFDYISAVESAYISVFNGLNLLMEQLLVRMEAAKSKLNALDFDDLQIYMLKLLQLHPEIRDQLKKQYEYILVDEFQDIDPLQSDIIQMLSHDQFGNLDSNRLFIVGDPKQSIYGFRNADVSLFRIYIDELQQQDSETIKIKPFNRDISSLKSERKGLIELSENFRSEPVLIHYFNETLKPILSQESEFDVEFQALQAVRRSKDSEILPVTLNLHIIPEDDPGDPIAQLARQIAGQISRIVIDPAYQQFVSEDDTLRTTPIRFGDIAILFRNRTHMQQFEQIFREQNIPYLTYKGRGFYQKQEIMDLYYIMKSVALPEDNFALLNALRSNFLGLSDITLFYLSQIEGPNYWDKLKKLKIYLSESTPDNKLFNKRFRTFLIDRNMTVSVSGSERQVIENILIHYQDWNTHVIAGRFSRLLDEIIETFNVKYLIQHQRDSQQKLANLDKLIHYIYENEQTAASPFFHNLLEDLQNQIYEEVQEGEAAIFAEEENKVRLLTIHSAKGMEFPVVFLPLLEKSFRYDSDFFLDKKYGFAFNLNRSLSSDSERPFAYQFLAMRDRQKVSAEEKRLFYVANTRAKDYLFLHGIVSKKRKITDPSYLKWLLDSHTISQDDVLSNSLDRERLSQAGIELKIYPPEDQADEISQNIPPKNQAPKVFPLDEEKLKYVRSLEQEPASQMYSVTQLMIFQEDKERYIKHFYLNDAEIRKREYPEEYVDEKGGAEWGSIVHKLLENYYIRDKAGDIAKIEQLKILETEGQLVIKYRDRLLEILESIRKSDFSKNLQKENAFSEYSIEIRLKNFILKGIFDLLFKNTENLWEIIDFKTNRIKASEVASLSQKYDFQRRAYALLLSSIFPEQAVYPVSLLYLEPMIRDRYEFNKLEIQQIKLDTLKLMDDIFQYESTIFHPKNLFNP